jgi:hypothetical protein
VVLVCGSTLALMLAAGRHELVWNLPGHDAAGIVAEPTSHADRAKKPYSAGTGPPSARKSVPCATG